jgi:hypothetical protein
VSLRPSAEESPIAIYVHRDRLEICLEPKRAIIRWGSLDGSDIRKVTDATSQWVIPEVLLPDNGDKILEGAREAIKWRRDGVRFRQPGKTSTVSGGILDDTPCQIHFIPRRICECNE